MFNKKAILAAAAALAIGGVAQAATLTLTPVVTAYYLPDFTPAPIPAGNSAPGIYQIDVVAQVSNLSAGQTGFGAVSFNFLMTPGLSANTTATWLANNPTVDVNGATPGGLNPLFFVNSDAGGSSTDLQNVTVSVAAGAAFSNTLDPRYWVAQAGGPAGINTTLATANANHEAGSGAAANLTVGHPPFILGTGWVDRSPEATGALLLTPNTGQLGLKMSTGAVEVESGTQFVLNSINFDPIGGGEIPEPATLGLAAFGALGLLRRRRA